MKKLLNEFKAFAVKGNAIDLAIGVVIGSAFGKITSSLVEDIINPIIGFIAGDIDYSDKMYVLKPAVGSSTEVAIKYGSLVTVLINFLLVAFALFLIVRYLNKIRSRFEAKEQDIEESKITPPKEEVVLLREIRDSLKK